MALKRITLTTADRRLIYILMLKPYKKGEKVTVEAARQVREIRRRFDGRSFGKMFDKFIDRLSEWNIETFSTWDNMMDAAELLEEIDEIVEAEEVEEEANKLIALKKQVKEFCEPREFTIDDDRLIWLQDLLIAHDWKMVRITEAAMDPSGQVTRIQKDVEVEVHPSQMEAVAEIADKLSNAINSASISEEREEKENKK